MEATKPRARKRASVTMMLLMFFISSGQEPFHLPSTIVHDVYIDRSVQLTPELVHQAEAIYIDLSHLPNLTEAQCEQLISAKALIEMTWMLPQRSNLYPSILDEKSIVCASDDIAVHLISANAYHENGQYELALSEFWKVIRNPTNDRLATTAQFNLIAVHNALGNLDSAIYQTQQLLQKIDPTSSNQSYSMHQNLQINLAGLYNADYNPQRALEVIASTDTTGASSYWQNIYLVNALLSNKVLLNVAQCKAIWDEHLRTRSLLTLAKRSYNEIISQSLISNDFIYFQRLRNGKISEIEKALQDINSPYTALFSTELTDSQATELWNDFVLLENRLLELALSKKAAQGDQLQELDDIRIELEKSQSINSRWELTALAALTACVLGLLSFIWGSRHKKKKLKAQLKSALAHKGNTNTSPSRHLNQNDIRILGDAIAYGKRVSDALLVLKKINENTDTNGSRPHEVDWSKINHFDELKRSEKEILEYIMLDFDVKEIARVLNCSVSHVYNVRSKIRQALDIPPEDQIKDWVQIQIA